ncbi:MAG TPA: hypothetical protein VH161_10485 [Candidatus Acidoferrales bacterium]|nr:hypothetical protein [Candidatus Acidoferrales bacterium]
MAAALEVGCATLYSEDFQGGQTIYGRITIWNPCVQVAQALHRLRKKSIPTGIWKRWHFCLYEFVALTAGGQPGVAVPQDFFRSV